MGGIPAVCTGSIHIDTSIYIHTHTEPYIHRRIYTHICILYILRALSAKRHPHCSERGGPYPPWDRFYHPAQGLSCGFPADLGKGKEPGEGLSPCTARPRLTGLQKCPSQHGGVRLD